MATLQTYTDLITSEHSSKPNYLATIETCCAPFVDIQNVSEVFSQDFDLNTAIGVQLDAIGIRVGISRSILVPLNNLYFSLDVLGLGLDQGWLEGPYDQTNGTYLLDDTTYRQLLTCKILANSWDGTAGTMGTILQQMFPDSNIFVQDNQNMSVYVGMTGTLPSTILQAIFLNGLIPLAPAGVLTEYVVTPVDGSPIFGLDVENEYISGLDVGGLVTTPPLPPTTVIQFVNSQKQPAYWFNNQNQSINWIN